mgnify:CR=1 FL=1
MTGGVVTADKNVTLAVVRRMGNHDLPDPQETNRQRDPDEVAVLIMDLVRRGVIEERRGGATGKRKEVAA